MQHAYGCQRFYSTWPTAMAEDQQERQTDLWSVYAAESISSYSLNDRDQEIRELRQQVQDLTAVLEAFSLTQSQISEHETQAVEARVAFYSPREESFPIPLKYIDVSRTTHTNSDVKQEKRIDDYWNIDVSRDLSDPWTEFTQFTLLDEKVPD